MKAIFASKLYKASKNKDKIHAAINDPLNVELVQQLKSYLDDEYIDEKYLGGDESSDTENTSEGELPDIPTDDSDESMGGGFSGGGRSFGGGPSGGPSGGGSKPDSDMGLADEHADELADLDSERASVVPDDADVESTIDIEPVDGCNIEDRVDEIRNILDSNPETSGINRIMVHDDELWIHYNDDINLNNVMEPVIYALSDAGFDMLRFNRLARTENAIVFCVEPCESVNRADPDIKPDIEPEVEPDVVDINDDELENIDEPR